MSQEYSRVATSIPELDAIVEQLCRPESLRTVWHRPAKNSPMPSLECLREMMDRLRSALFPGFFGPSTVRRESMTYHLSANLDSIYNLLKEQILRGICFACTNHISSEDYHCTSCEEQATAAAMTFMQTLPELRRKLTSDARAAYEGDPAASSPGETIFCYPSMYAMIHHRIAHELYKLKIPVIPRIISEMAHSRSGIDIHPGATIGDEFFIDHGTGVVIGETAIIGRSCRLYQGVTLGALSFPKAQDGSLIKGIPRHPILEDNVTVYAGATILGRITIGTGAIIGGNVWVTYDVPAGGKVAQKRSREKNTKERLIGEAMEK